MRVLTFNNKDGDFYLDQHESIGDFIEVGDVTIERTKRVQGQSCYQFRVYLQFCCNTSDPEYVEFYTFIRRIRYIFIDMSNQSNNTFSLRSQRNIGKNLYNILKKELVT